MRAETLAPTVTSTWRGSSVSLATSTAFFSGAQFSKGAAHVVM
jgi:hypothetical protein